MTAPDRGANPWQDERVVVVSDDPWSVEAAVVQLEAWGAQPAVMFERSRALRALAVAEPDVVVLDFGRDPGAVRTLLGELEAVAPVLPGALHGAPVVALAEAPLASRLERDAWAPLHVVPHDDPGAVRGALQAALEEAAAGAAGGRPAAVPATMTAGGPAGVPGPALARRRSAAPLLAAGAAALGFLGLATAGFLRSRAERAATAARPNESGGRAGGTLGGSTPATAVPASVPAAAPPTAVSAGAATAPPTAVPTAASTVAVASAPNAPPAAVSAPAPTTAPALAPASAPALTPVSAGAPRGIPPIGDGGARGAVPDEPTVGAGAPSPTDALPATPGRLPPTGSR